MSVSATASRTSPTSVRRSRSRTASRKRTTSVWPMSASEDFVASACRFPRITVRVSPIASHAARIGRTTTRTIRPVSERGTVRPRVDAGVGERLAAGWQEPVAQAADSLDRRAVGSKLLAHLGDVDVDGPGLAREVGAPDVLEQGVAGEDDPGIAGQRDQQVELARSQVDPAPGHASHRAGADRSAGRRPRSDGRRGWSPRSAAGSP